MAIDAGMMKKENVWFIIEKESSVEDFNMGPHKDGKVNVDSLGWRRFQRNGLKIEMSPLKIQSTGIVEGRRLIWELSDTFKLTIEAKGTIYSVRVPKLFRTDMASIPFMLQWILGERDRYAPAAVVHDFFCTNKLEQWFSNSGFRTILMVLECPQWRQVLFLIGLQCVGYGSVPLKVWEWMSGLFKKVK